MLTFNLTVRFLQLPPKSCLLCNENIIIIRHEKYNFNIALKNSHKVQIRLNNKIFQVKTQDSSDSGGVRLVIILTMYVSPFFSMKLLHPMKVYKSYDSVQ